ncbi:MAG: DUF6763 family protein [Steroidobacteraceae bacterium]
MQWAFTPALIRGARYLNSFKRDSSRTSIGVFPHFSLGFPGACFTADVVAFREPQINNPAQVGQWYTRLDTNEVFLVTGYDDKSSTIEIQAINGDLDEIDAQNWKLQPLAFADPPEDWTQALDDVEVPSAAALLTPIERFLSL